MGYLQSRPARGGITEQFGPRPKPTPTSPAIHYGQDYGWGGGDAIFAARGGVVTAYGYTGAYGNRLVIQHGRSSFGSSIETWYCHLTRSLVGVGAVVNAGQEVAVMGATGNVTAKHLHFELRIDGVATNPEPYFSGATTAGGATPINIEEDILSALSDEEQRELLAAIRQIRSTVPAILHSPDGAYRFADALGGENIGLYLGSDINAVDAVNVVGRVYGIDEVNQAEGDIAAAIATRRAEAFKEDIVNRVLDRLTPAE